MVELPAKWCMVILLMGWLRGLLRFGEIRVWLISGLLLNCVVLMLISPFKSDNRLLLVKDFLNLLQGFLVVTVMKLAVNQCRNTTTHDIQCGFMLLHVLTHGQTGFVYAFKGC